MTVWALTTFALGLWLGYLQAIEDQERQERGE